MKAPHLSAALSATLVAATILLAGDLYAKRMERRYIHALAPQLFEQKTQGAALQRAAFQQPDLLPLYGSSELTLANPYHASTLFRNYPTGFTVFPVGKAGTTCLIWLQQLTAIGADLHGKKVALSLSPGWFSRTPNASWYKGNFAHLGAGELAFNTQLSFAVKQAAARRMLEYPETLESDPLLRFALRQLADGSVLSRALYYAAFPLGKLANLVLRLQDDWETLAFIRQQIGLQSAAPHEEAAVDWPALLRRADEQTQQLTDSNPFGFDNQFWRAHAGEITERKDTPTHDELAHYLEHSHEWTDLDLLLRALRDLGAQPLLLSMPINGTYYDSLGIPYSLRQAYYDRLHTLARAYGVPVVDFADHDGDIHFNFDSGYHLNRKGWVYYDQALDAFYHDTRIPDAQ